MTDAAFDLAILLGGTVRSNGNLPDAEQQQVQTAVALYKAGVVRQIMACGSHGYKDKQEAPITEAQAYRAYAMALGVPDDVLFVDDASKESIGSLYFAKRLMLEHSWQRAIIIPAVGHSQERVMYLAQKIFDDDCHWEIRRGPVDTDPLNLEREERSLSTTQAIIGDIADGDHEAIYHRLCATHPAYGGTLYTMAELRALLSPHETTSLPTP